MGFYQFKANKRATEATLGQQVEKLVEEVEEVVEEFQREPFGTDDLLVETWDVIFTAEGILRKFNKDQVQQARDRVVEKAKRRGDF